MHSQEMASFSEWFLQYQRLLVGTVYLAYLVAICVALAGYIDVAITVMICLSIHFVGLLVGVVWLADRADVYPDQLGNLKTAIQAWDAVQLFFLGSLVGNMLQTDEISAVVAIVGIIGCFYKVYVTRYDNKCHVKVVVFYQ